MIDVNELRSGVTFELDDRLYKVLEYGHHKPGRGKATIRVKIRDLVSGAIVEKAFNSGDKVQDVRLDYRVAQFLYSEGDVFHFMDVETYEQPELNSEMLGDAVNFLTANLQVKLTFYQGKPLDIDLPTSVDLKIADAEVGLKGDTATGANKLVTTETGLKVQVPLFVQSGDTIRVDTRNGAYITRA